MAGQLVIRNGVKLLGSLPSGVGENVLTLDTTTRDVGNIPAIDTSAYITTALTPGHIYIGNISGIATATPITGQVLLADTGVTTIAADTITNVNINSGAGIQYSKLTLTNSVVNNDIATNANIARTKLAAGQVYRVLINDGSGVMSEQSAITANRVLVSDSNGLPTHSSVTTTVLGYLDTTSSIQDQLNNRLQFSSAITPVNGDILYYDSGVWTNLAVGADGQVLTLTSGLPSWENGISNGIPSGGTVGQYLNKIDGTPYNVQWSTLDLAKITDITATAAEVNKLSGVTTTTAQLNYLNTATSDIQTQLNNKLASSLSQGAIFVGNGSNVASQLAAGTNGQVLQVVGGSPQWQTLAGTGTVTSVGATAPAAGFTISGSPISTSGTFVFTLADDLAAVEGIGTTGIVRRTGVNTWTAGTAPTTEGGTGLTSYTTGDVIYASASNVLSKLAAGTDGYVLTLASGIPSWAPAAAGGVTSVDVSGGTTGLTTTGGPITTSGTITLTGTLAVSNGGTGLTALGTANQLLRVNAGATALEYFTPPYISGNQTITLSGEASGSGATSIAVTLANSAVIGKVLTGYTSGAGTVAATDTILQAIQKLNGNDALAWKVTGTSTLTGVATITSNANSQHIFNGTWTATANNQYHLSISPSLTGRAGQPSGETVGALTINPTLIAGVGSNTSNLVGLLIQPTFNDNTTTGTVHAYIRCFDGTNVRFQVTDTNITMAGSTTLTITNGVAGPMVQANSASLQLNANSASGNVLMQIAGNSWFGVQASNSVGASMFALPTTVTNTATQQSSRNFNWQVNEWTGSAAQTNYWTSKATQSTATNQLSYWDLYFGTTGSAPSLTNLHLRIRNTNGNIYIGAGTNTTVDPTARLHIAAGTATASSAPIKLTAGTNLTTPEAGAVEFDGTNYFVTSSTTRYTLAKTLTNTAALDFPSTAAQTSSDLTITVTGAALGDVVMLGVPAAAVVGNTCYTAFVSAADTVTVRLNNYDILNAADPTSATFRVSVIKY